jgi:hypothetical protein
MLTQKKTNDTSAKADSTTRSAATREPATARRVRYWLLNGTHVELEVPYKKIGVPFDKIPDDLIATLTDSEKTKIIAELSNCEAQIRAGNVDMLEMVVEICRRCALPLPGWVLPYVLSTINTLLRLNTRRRQAKVQREIQQIRWAAVHHLRLSQRLTWDDAYAAACRDLNSTRARGREETIRASYKWMNRHPFTKALRQNGEVDDFAREQYKNRQSLSERLISIESRDRARPKYRPNKKPR